MGGELRNFPGGGELRFFREGLGMCAVIHYLIFFY